MTTKQPHPRHPLRKRIREVAVLRGLTLVVAVVSLSPARLVADKGFASYAEGKQFLTDIKDQDLVATPVWKAAAENLPLSARRAINLATAMKNVLVKDSKDRKWQFEAADLYPDVSVDRWHWEVTFSTYVRPGRRTEGDEELRLVVLMDGRVIKPVVRPRARGL